MSEADKIDVYFTELFFRAKMALLTAAPRYEYTLIDCCSKDDIPLYFKLMNKFSIPYVALNHIRSDGFNLGAEMIEKIQAI